MKKLLYLLLTGRLFSLPFRGEKVRGSWIRRAKSDLNLLNLRRKK